MTITFTEWDGKPIGADGAYSGVPIDRYHGSLCAGPSVSKSGLWTLDSQSPAHYFVDSYLNEDREPEEQKDHFNVGQAAHFLFLKEEFGSAAFGERFAIRPSEFSDWRTKAAKEWRDAQIADGKMVLTPDQMTAIEGMALSISRHPLAKHLLTGHVEKTLVVKDDKTGIWLKSRPDVVPVADGVVADLKCEASAAPLDFVKSIANHGYAMQAAMTATAMKRLFGITVEEFVFVVIEKSKPYPISINPIHQDWIGYAKRQVRRAADRFAQCVETGEWPGYQDETTANMPFWLQKRLEDEDKFGQLPKEEIA